MEQLDNLRWRKSSYSGSNGGNCVEVGWRKSSYSGSNGGGCVEVDSQDNVILVRDTKEHGRGQVHRFTTTEWRAFIAAARNSQPDLR
jgi:hypothetical protein